MINYLKYRFISYFFSLFLIGLFIVGLVYKKYERPTSFLYSVEFTGGTQVVFITKDAIGIDLLTSTLETNGYQGAIVRQFINNEYLIRVKDTVQHRPNLVKELKEVLLSLVKDESHLVINQVEAVGAGVGDEMSSKCMWAVFIALIVMLLFIWFRMSSWAFSLANFFSLAHDILAILLLVLWFDYEISLNIVAAVLFILGYSINDTIVIFSRIRENMGKITNLKECINISISETMRRTLLTSFFTALTVSAILLLGGEALSSLSAALLLGIVFGTYSSIFIAAPLVYDFKKILNN